MKLIGMQVQERIISAILKTKYCEDTCHVYQLISLSAKRLSQQNHDKY